MGVPDSARAKLGRAHMHADDLHGQIGAFARVPQPAYGVRKQFDPELGCFVFTVTNVRPLPIPWNLIIGDCLTNARSALDHLAWHLVILSGTTPTEEQARVIQFPIYETEGGYRSNVARRLLGVTDPDQLAVVECYQPWKVAPNAADHPLALLASLGNIDRHRYIEPVVAPHVDFDISMVSDQDFEPAPPGVLMYGAKWDAATGEYTPTPAHYFLPFEEDTELARVCGEVTGPDPDVEMDFSGTAQIAFRDGGGAEETLNKVLATITDLFGKIETFV